MSAGKNNLRILLVALAIIGVGIGLFLSKGRAPADDPFLGKPLLDLGALEPGPVFMNPAARQFVDASGEQLQESARAVREPDFWRQLDRRERYRAVFLCGDPAEYRPLLQHLVESKDWALAHLDHVSLLFRRAPGGGAWSGESLEAVIARAAGLDKRTRVHFLCALAQKLVAVERAPLARGYLDEAIELAGGLAEPWTGLAVYHAHYKRWPEALDAADRALALDRNSPPALSVRAQVLLGLRRNSQAFETSERLVRLTPDDPAALFLHARVAHAAHAYGSEGRALEKLVAIAERQGFSPAGYYIYLAQSHAAASEAQPALEWFQKALGCEDISPEQREFVVEAIERIRSRVRM